MAMRPWSFSNLEKFETCPRQFYEVKIAKSVQEPPTVHTVWGKEVHTALENRIKHGTPLPEGMTQWEGIAAKAAALPGEKHTELAVALDRAFQPTDWDTAWTRGVIDLAVIGDTTAAVVDWKTGKRKPTQQLDLYAAYVMALHPRIERVTTAFVWLKEQKTTKGEVTRDDYGGVWGEFLTRAARLEKAYERNSWPERPSGLCNGWCPVRACIFHKDKQ